MTGDWWIGIMRRFVINWCELRGDRLLLELQREKFHDLC